MSIKISLNTALAVALIFATSAPLAEPLEAQAPEAADNANAAQLAAKIANMTGDWLNDKLSTPGTSGELREMERSKQNGQLALRFNYIKGAPEDQDYNLISWPINAPSPSEQMKGLSVGADGLVVCAGKSPEQCVGEKENDPVDFMLSPAKGEVFRMALVSADGDTKIFFATVPDPIIEKHNSCSLEVVRLMPKIELILLRAKGYRPNEELLFSSKSYNESHEKQAKADSDGAYLLALTPFVKDKRYGKTTLSLKGGACAPVLSFEWGN